MSSQTVTAKTVTAKTGATGPRPPWERAPAVAATLLLPLVDRVPAMAAPCRMHSSIDRIEASLAEWTREVGLETPARAGFERMAGRAFAGFGVDAALLFAKWLTWLFHFDDEWDEKPAGHAAEIVEATFARLGRLTGSVPPPAGCSVPAQARGGAVPLQARGAAPVETAFQDLWRITAGRMSACWRERFALGLREQGAACRAEADNRRAGRVPSRRSRARNPRSTPRSSPARRRRPLPRGA
jgi:hypothetical protein